MHEVRKLAALTLEWTQTYIILGGAAPWARPNECEKLPFDLIVSGESDHPNTVSFIAEGVWGKDKLYCPAITPGELNWVLPPVRRWDGQYHSYLDSPDG